MANARKLIVFHRADEASGATQAIITMARAIADARALQYDVSTHFAAHREQLDLLVVEDNVRKLRDIIDCVQRVPEIVTVGYCFSSGTFAALVRSFPVAAKVVTLDFNLAPPDSRGVVDGELLATSDAFDELAASELWRDTVVIGLSENVGVPAATRIKRSISRRHDISLPSNSAVFEILDHLLRDALNRYDERVEAHDLHQRTITQSRNAVTLLTSGFNRYKSSAIEVPPTVQRRLDALAASADDQLTVAIRTLDMVAASDTKVLLQGAPGVGKTWLARRLHELSKRAGDFVKVDCGHVGPERDKALADLFGQARNFSGADRARSGYVQQAENGTLFFDELSNLSADAQLALLRFFEDLEYQPYAARGERMRRANVRLVFASNEDLDRTVRDGRFRSDLRSRLGVVVVRIPDLRSRLSELPSLISEILGRDTASVRITADAWMRLLDYEWPYNIRQLQDVLRAAITFAGAGPIRPEHLMLEPIRTPRTEDTVVAPTLPHRGDAMWRAYVQGIPFFACSPTPDGYRLELMGSDGEVRTRAVATARHYPALLREWLDEIRDAELARACIIRAVRECGNRIAAGGAIDRIGRYVNAGHKESVRVAISRGYPPIFEGVNVQVVKRTDTREYLARHFSDLAGEGHA